MIHLYSAHTYFTCLKCSHNWMTNFYSKLNKYRYKMLTSLEQIKLLNKVSTKRRILKWWERQWLFTSKTKSKKWRWNCFQVTRRRGYHFKSSHLTERWSGWRRHVFLLCWSKSCSGSNRGRPRGSRSRKRICGKIFSSSRFPAFYRWGLGAGAPNSLESSWVMSP